MLHLDPIPAAQRAIILARRNQCIPLEDGPVGDLMRDVLVEGLPAWESSRSGFLYLACSPAEDHVYKIGRTRTSVARRMKTLNGPGVLVPWLAVTAWQVYDAPGLEALAHTACAEFRLHGELFRAPWAALSTRIQDCIDQDAARLRQSLGDIVGDALVLKVARCDQPGILQVANSK